MNYAARELWPLETMMKNETATPETSSDPAGRAMSELLAANYRTNVSEHNDCDICKHIREEDAPTGGDFADDGTFKCSKHGEYVEAFGTCDDFDYFDE